MTLIIAGTMRAPTDQIEGLRPHVKAMMAASQAEDGCIAYAFAEDLAQPGLLRLFECWRDQAALDAHKVTPHMAAWKQASPRYGVSDRALVFYEIASEHPL